LVDRVDPLERAAAHANLGLPLPPRTRYRSIKRVLARAARLFTNHQVEVNRALVDSVQGLRTVIAEAERGASAAADRLADDLAAVRTELSDVQLDSLERVERISRDLVALRQELQVSRRGGSEESEGARRQRHR
jgi:hypothetical protein